VPKDIGVAEATQVPVIEVDTDKFVVLVTAFASSNFKLKNKK
jgi:hypothetical protein